MKYLVEIPITGKVTVEVVANSEKEAIEKAMDEFDLTLNPSSELGYEIEEWEYHSKVNEGNFSHAVLDEVECSLIHL